MNDLKLPNYSADCCNYTGHICFLFSQPPPAPAPPHNYQDTFGLLKGGTFYTLPNETTPENAHLEIPFIKPEIYCKLKK